jgi:Asp-tRNA(Asn)/Glu-tRNA(Gln) amidotransferase A subunit family amidase
LNGLRSATGTAAGPTASGLHALGAGDMLRGYRRGEFSPLEVMQSVLAHIDRWEPRLCATYLLRPEQALQQARASTGRWQQGAPCGPLDGVPVTIKENLATAGDPMPAGTAASRLPLAAQDAPAPARLREAGAIMVSKTTMPDYGMLSSGLSSFHQLSRNPAAPAPAPVRLRRQATARCMSAPTLAAPCGCLPAGAVSSRSSPAMAASRSTRPTPAVPPAP